MPVPKRWHPVSRDLNDDPEVWELTETFGDRAVRLWLEILGILDKTENRWRLTGTLLPSLSRKVRMKPETIRASLEWMVVKGWLVATEFSADGSPLAYSASKYAKYHRIRGTKEEPSLDLTNQTKPNLPYLPEKKEESGSFFLNKFFGEELVKKMGESDSGSTTVPEIRLNPELAAKIRQVGNIEPEEALNLFRAYCRKEGKNYAGSPELFLTWLEIRRNGLLRT